MIKKIWHTCPLFLALLPLVFVVHYVNYYYGLLHWRLIVPTLVWYFIIPVIIYGLLTLTLRRKAPLALAMLWLLAVFYFFPAIHEWLAKLFPESLPGRYSFQLPLLLVISIALTAVFWKGKYDHEKWYFRLNSLFGLLLLAGLIQWAGKWTVGDLNRNDQGDPSKPLSAQYRRCDTCSMPDIYFLLFDGYTNARTLQSEFGYSNTGLTNYLDSLGFYSVTGSRSNYNFTHMSIASELDLDYLGRLDVSHPFHTLDFFQSYYSIRKNELTRILARQGYGLANYSIFPIDDAPLRVTPFLEELHYRSVPGQTFFNALYRDIGWHWPLLADLSGASRAKRKKIEMDLKRIQETFDGVLQMASREDPNPLFTYAHFIMPHETWYFDSLGNRLPVEYTMHTPVNRHDYLQQLVYTNQFLIKPLVDSIFSRSKRPFVIVLQGDHGYRNYPPEKINLEFENLQAIYWPGRDYGKLYSSQSPVNTFRQVINHLFQKNYPLLSDSSINLMKVFEKH